MSLRIWLPLTKDLRNQGLDDVTVTNNGATFNSAGKLGGCYSFGTGNSYIIVDSAPLKTFTEFSFACWVKIISWNTNYSTIFAAKNSTGVSWNNLIFSLLRDSSTSALCFNISNGSSYTATSCRTETLSLNTWYHIACTYQNGQIKLYQDGNVVSIYNTNVIPNFNSIVNLWIGKSNENSYQSNNLLNDVRIYDHALSPLEVKHIAQGLILHYPLNRGGWGQENLITQAMIDTDPWKSAIQGTYTVDGKTGWILSNNLLYSKSGAGANNIFSGLTYEDNAQYTISFKWRDDYRTDGKSSSLYIRFKYSDGTYSQVISSKDYNYWKEEIMTSTVGKTVTAITTTYGNGGNLLFTDLKLEKGTIKTPTSPIVNSDLYNSMGINDNIEYDTSGYCNNGTRTGTFSWTSDTPKYNVSTKFSTNTIKNISFNFTSNTWTVAFWYYYDTAPSAYQGFLCLSRNAGGDADKKLAAMPNSSYIWFKFENTSLTISSLKIKVWTHIIMTFDGTNGRVYENGMLKGTTNAASSIYTDCDDFVIGARANAANATVTACQLVGNMSDVRFYATALSADDVKSLYQNSAYIDNQGNIYGAVYEEV